MENWQDEQDKSALELARSKLKPRTDNQARYFKAIETSTVTICTGPAGTGKTYIPCALAAQMLKEGRIERLILTRPMVECGGRMGFLPGDKDAKVQPWMRPLLDVLNECFSANELLKLMRENIVELQSLELMRGQSIKRAIIICDEAQNADRGQLRMLCTRLDVGTRLIISGDFTQTDLYDDGLNPLVEMIRRYCYPIRLPAVSYVRLTHDDCQRPDIVRQMDKRWEGPTPRLQKK